MVPAGYQPSYPPSGYPQARQAPQQPQQQAPQQPQQPPPMVQPGEPVTIENLWEKMKQWRGGQAHKSDYGPCPQCNGNHYSSRDGAMARRGPPPAPHCFDCGYNGMFTQGMASSWQGG